MTGPTPSDVAPELEQLRDDIEVGLVRVDGVLALLVRRSDQTDRLLTDHVQRLDDLERRRWPLPSLVALAALAALMMPVWQTFAD
ncbi:hypothetical protein ABT104_15870 [Streptomyces mobaraensis]|uniref:hypothetical protein n=1 Tax=Streptomyces mobaraensis TaxID=35621 RepID=UPI0033229D54